MIAFASSLDQAGPLTRDVTDAALLLSHMVGARDPCDSTSLDYPEPIGCPARADLARRPHRRAGRADRRGIEAGVLAAFESRARAGALARRQRRALRAPSRVACAVGLLRARSGGGLVEPRPLRRRPLWLPREQARPTFSTMYTRTRHDGFGAEVKRRIMLGTYALSSGYYDAYYGRAQRVRTKIAEDFAAAFQRFDLIATPTSPGVAFELGRRPPTRSRCTSTTSAPCPRRSPGIPAISIPCGLAPPPEGGRAAGRLPARGRRRSARTGCSRRRSRSSRRSPSTAAAIARMSANSSR